MKTIIVTGSPGTGKTTVAKKIAKQLGYGYVDVNSVILENNLRGKYDRKRRTYVIDIGKLNKVLVEIIAKSKSMNKAAITKNQSKISLKKKNQSIRKEQKNKEIQETKGIVIDSHLSHYLPKRYVDLCVVTKCQLKKLESRLRTRKYIKSKIRENLDCEIFDVCVNEAKESGHNMFVIDTTETLNMGKVSSDLRKCLGGVT